MSDAEAGKRRRRLCTAAEDAPGGFDSPLAYPAEKDPPVDHTRAILHATKRVATALKDSGLPFALTGSVAAYAHGVPGSLQHDTDFCIRREDAEPALAALADEGIERVPAAEDWLLKARADGEDVDLIFELAHRPVTSELLDDAVVLPVDSVSMPVLPPTELLATLLSALTEHHCDFGALLPLARSLRERIDWDRLRPRYQPEPLPDAFLYLLERTGVIAPRKAVRP